MRRSLSRAASAAALLLLFAISCSPDAPPPDLRVVVISDLNSSYGSTEYEPQVHQVVQWIRERWHPDLVLSAGDLIAAQKPALSDENVEAMWAAFDSLVAMPLRRAGIPFGFTLGNHDGSAHPAHQRDREMALAHWRVSERHPGVSFIDSSHFPVYYSFSEEELFVLVWDASYAGTIEDSTMMAWVHDQLSSDHARSAGYRFVVGHLPLYGVAEGRNRPGEVLNQADSLRGMLERYGVHTYVSGHQHAYYPGRRGDVELLYSAALGQGPRPLIGSDESPVQAVTILDFHIAADSIAYTTYEIRDGDLNLIETAELPPVIHGFNGYVVRRDLPDSVAMSSDSTGVE